MRRGQPLGARYHFDGPQGCIHGLEAHKPEVTPTSTKTFGLDHGDRISRYCQLDAQGVVVAEGRIPTAEAGLLSQRVLRPFRGPARQEAPAVSRAAPAGRGLPRAPGSKAPEATSAASLRTPPRATRRTPGWPAPVPLKSSHRTTASPTTVARPSAR